MQRGCGSLWYTDGGSGASSGLRRVLRVWLGPWKRFKNGPPSVTGLTPQVMANHGLAVKDTELAEEFASGRFAVRATLDMLMQGGLAGSVWGDWAFTRRPRCTP